MTFNILDPQLDLRKSRFLEASAGTGKTFSIENLYTRLLMENSDLKSENILVVTFTKAAAHDLKNRIKKCLQKAKENPSNLQATLLLEDAIYNFDQAAIFTIHGFCFKALQENSFEAGIFQAEENDLAKEDLIDVVKSYLATELDTRFISLGQLEIVLKNFQGSVLKLQESLLHAILKGQDVLASTNCEQSFNSFCEVVYKHKGEQLLQDLIRLAPDYYDLCDRSGTLKQEPLEKLTAFAELFEKEELTTKDFDRQLKEKLYVYHAFHESNRKPKARQLPLELPVLKELWPIVREAGDPLAIFASMASGCQKKLYGYLEESNKLEFSYLLKKMQKAASSLKPKLRAQYKVAIIDEFQDTDPLQWNIFQQLFFEENSQTIVYLVGDPKQSIYSFRSADIYTYLDAEKAIQDKATLQTNYRSQPSLIRALNDLFDEGNTPGWIDLPSQNTHLPYQPVLPAENSNTKTFKDLLGSVHFCVATADKGENLEDLETKTLFPFFVQEIKRLNVLENISFQEMAILVHDRFQAKRLMRVLNLAGVPNILQKTGSLVQSRILPALQELLTGLLFPKQESLFKAAMGGRIIGLDNDHIRAFEESSLLAKAMEQALFLKETWQTQGFGQLFQELLESKWGNKTSTVRENLLTYEDGGIVYDELMSLAGILMSYECNHYASPERLLEYLEELILIKDADNEEFKIQQDVTRDAVNILTIHASKGLEYGIVFALGLCHRSPSKTVLIQDRKDWVSSSLGFFPTDSEEYLLHLRECDAEKMRQLYVAMTRAKHRLYVPCVKGWKVPKQGTASPMELFLARHRQTFCGYEELYNRLQGDVVSNLMATSEISISEPQGIGLSEPCQEKQAMELHEPSPVVIPGQPLYCSSFSSLTIHSEAFQLSQAAPKDFESCQKSIHTLPAGKKTGILFHEILQKVPLDVKDLGHFIEPFLRNTEYHAWIEVFVSTIAHVLNAPFLKDVSPAACFREMEFLFSSVEHQGFINGVVDMVFLSGDKYYLLDWKTNWLGSSSDAYSQEAMHEAMLANQYPLQAKLYAQALRRYVKPLDIRPFSESFGGAYYVFLRGLQPGTDFGIYHFFPEIEDG